MEIEDLDAYDEVDTKVEQISKCIREANLIEEAGKERMDYLRRLSVYYIETRYPEEKESLAEKCTCDLTKFILNSAEEVVLWLQGKLK